MYHQLRQAIGLQKMTEKIDIEATAILAFKMIYSGFPNDSNFVSIEDMKIIVQVIKRAAELAEEAIATCQLLEPTDISSIYVTLGKLQ